MDGVYIDRRSQGLRVRKGVMDADKEVRFVRKMTTEDKGGQDE